MICNCSISVQQHVKKKQKKPQAHPSLRHLHVAGKLSNNDDNGTSCSNNNNNNNNNNNHTLLCGRETAGDSHHLARLSIDDGYSQQPLISHTALHSPPTPTAPHSVGCARLSRVPDNDEASAAEQVSHSTAQLGCSCW